MAEDILGQQARQQARELDRLRRQEKLSNQQALAEQQAGDKFKQYGRQLQAIRKIRDKVKKITDILGQGQPIGFIGYLLFFLMLVFAVGIDLIPFVTGDLGSIVDWILDISFFFFVSICLFLITMDLIGSFVGRKAVVNMAQTIIEFIPVIDVIPFHVLAVAIIFLDVKYGILKLKNLAKLKP